MCQAIEQSRTYDHRVWRTGLPVRSAVLKPHAGRLVVWWVTTCESLLLYVFTFFCFWAIESFFGLLPAVRLSVFNARSCSPLGECLWNSTEQPWLLISFLFAGRASACVLLHDPYLAIAYWGELYSARKKFIGLNPDAKLT
ncbi:hypothetical protein BJX66DRAFT_83412 [Aspergillus keveii]|uniref:Uncharacterized protein n=1 Tax=Aspergillus keveii TaxID=714993 RepID=A0ABR4FN49_9EURO